MYHVNSYLPDRQGESLQKLKDLTGLSISEFTRRLFDYGLQEKVLDEIIPTMSGQLQLNRVV